MLEEDDFGQPDVEGFAGVLNSGFLVFNGLLFLDATNFDEATASNLINRMSKKELQWYYNHVSLFLYVSDIKLQREWANRLEDSWRKKFKEQYSHMKVHVEREENDQEIILWFWNE